MSVWESGKVSLVLGNFYFFEHLLNLVLPRVVVCREMGRRGHVLLSPPVPGWQDILRSSRKFISNPVKWSPFLKYAGEISDKLYHDWAGDQNWFNEIYAERLSSFDVEEVAKLARLFSRLMIDKHAERRTQLTKEEALLLQRAIGVVGELEISGVYGSTKLSEFLTKPPSRSQQ